MKKIKYSELRNWREQSIVEKLADRNLNKTYVPLYQIAMKEGFDLAINVLRLHGYIETDFQN